MVKVGEKLDKYLDLARELKKLWKMKVKVIPIIDVGLGTILQKPGKETVETGDLKKN